MSVIDKKNVGVKILGKVFSVKKGFTLPVLFNFVRGQDDS